MAKHPEGKQQVGTTVGRNGYFDIYDFTLVDIGCGETQISVEGISGKTLNAFTHVNTEYFIIEVVKYLGELGYGVFKKEAE